MTVGTPLPSLGRYDGTSSGVGSTISDLIPIQAVDAPAVSVSQGLLLGITLVLLFPVSVYATAAIAKRAGVRDVEYTDALSATVLKNLSWVVATGVLNGMLGLSPLISLVAVGVIVPLVIYKRMLMTSVSQAAVVWFGVILVETVTGIVLVFGALGLGAWLDDRYNIPSLLAGVIGWTAA